MRKSLSKEQTGFVVFFFFFHSHPFSVLHQADEHVSMVLVLVLCEYFPLQG